ncbi:LamG domain-containing protein [Micromonospora sp. CPCC 205371]|nr:LamG domain-containing protein [Micromonospora sp. CPCC 205371]
MRTLWYRTGLVVALLAASMVAITQSAEQRLPERVITTAPDTATARELARRQRSAVVAADLTTETRLVHALPDGSMSAAVTNVPVRVQRNGRWVDIDTTLVRRADGTVAPRAASADYVFSGGGSAHPLIRSAVAGGSLAYRWPGTLPQPQLLGAVATYRDVLPGVDLTLRADPTGYVKRLVVRDAEAARNPALRRIRLGLETKGLTLTVRPDGGTKVRAPSGEAVLASSPPLMWDRAGSAVDGPADDAKRAPVQLVADADSLSLVPAPGFFDDPALRYPVVIDPSEHLAGRSHWALVYSGKPTQSYWYGDSDGLGKVGPCPYLHGGDCRGIGVARTYYSFETTFLAGRTIVDHDYTKLLITVNNGADCASRNHSLWRYDDSFSSSMTWNTQPGLSWAARTGVGCSGDAVWKLGTGVRLGGYTSYAVVSDNENDNRDGQLFWRRYASAAWLYVRFSAPPNEPNAVRVDPGLPAPCRWCGGMPYVDDPWVTFQAQLTDPDPGEALYADWDVYNNGNNNPHRPGGTLGSGNWHSHRVNVGAWDGQTIDWYVRARDGHPREGAPGGEGPWRRGPGPFVVDVTPPAAKPTVTSVMYPTDNRWHGGASVPGDFTFSPSGVTDIDHYLYGWTDEPGTRIEADALGGSATVSLTPPGDGPRDLYVRSVDRAGNKSEKKIHHFYVRPGNGPLAQWSLEGDAKDTAYLGWRDGSLLGGATYAPGAVGTGVSLDGASGRVAVQTGARTDTSFSVSAWAKIDRLNVEKATVVSQSGANNVGFSIQYEGWNDRFVFVLPQTDSTSPPGHDFVRAPSRPVVGEWTHFAGVYDATTKRIAFYVNGVQAGTAPHHPTWNAAGYFRIGYQEHGGVFTGFFPGMIDEVKLYDRPLSADEVRAAVGSDNVQTGYWKFDDDPTSRTATNAVPGGTAGVLAGGASFGPGPVDGAVRLGGIDDHVTMTGPVVRTDQSFTVAGWLTPDRAPASGHTHTAISQDGEVNSGFFLGYRNVDGGVWELYLPSADTRSPRATDSVVRSAARTAVVDRSTHVAAVYDASTGTIQLFVDGRASGSATRTGGFNASGAFRVGGGLAEGTRVNPWHGTVDEVRTYNRVLSEAELQGLVSRDAVAVARWAFDGNLVADPTAYNGRDGGPAVDYAGGQSTFPQPNDLAVRLDGSTTYVSAKRAVDTGRSFSVAAWARLDRTGGQSTVVSQDGSRISQFQLQANPDGAWLVTLFGRDDETNAVRVDVTGPVAQVGAWTHLAATYNAVSRRVEFYVNGVLVGSRDAVAIFASTTGDLQIGAGKWAGNRVGFFPGAVDDVSVWSRPLFADEIATMAGRDLSLVHEWKLDEPSGGRAADSVGARGGTRSGDAGFTAGRVGNAVHLSGTGGAITTPGVDVRTDKAFTVSAWVRVNPTNCATRPSKMDAVTVDGGTGSKFRLGHLVDDDQYQCGAWFFEMPEADQVTVTKASIATRLDEVGEWVHLVGVYDPAAKMMVIYVNGTRHDEGTLNTPWQAAGGLAIGRGQAGGQPAGFWTGDVDEVRLYTGALDAKRVETIYHSYPAEPVATAVPAPDAGHWKADENTGTTLADASGKGRTATFKGGASWIGGRDGYAVWLDGSTGYAETAAPALDTTRGFTATAWVYQTTGDTKNYAVVGQDGNRVSAFHLRYQGDVKRWAVVVPRADQNDAQAVTVLSTEAAAIGEWTHLAVSYDAEPDRRQLRLYVNGVLSAVQVGVTVPPSSGPVSIGRAKWNGTPTGMFARGVDDVRLYQHVLTAGQIRRMHDEASDVTFQLYRFDDDTTRDFSWRKNDATASGGITYGPGVAGKAAVFDGTGEATSTYTGVHMRDSFSVSAWVNLGRDDVTGTIVSQDGSYNSGFVLQYRANLKRWAFGQAGSDSEGALMMYVASQQAPVVNQWTHVAGVYDYTARQLRLYVDGKLVGTRDNVVLWVATGKLALGRSLYNRAKTQHFVGAIDEVRVGYGLPAENRLAIRAGWPGTHPHQLGRYVNAAGERYTAVTGTPPRDGYHVEEVLGRPVATGPNTATLHACQSGSDHFSSTDSGCEGAAKVGEIGRVYTVPPTNIPTVAIYRCVSGADRFDSRAADCGGATKQVTLGYVAAYVALNRYYHDDVGEHYAAATAVAPIGYRLEGPHGFLALTPVTGTVPLYGCLDGSDQFASTDATCGGKTVLGQLGRLWAQAPSGVDSRPLYRCAVNGQRFTSTSTTCEGMTMDTLLGYVLVNPPNTTAEFAA